MPASLDTAVANAMAETAGIAFSILTPAGDAAIAVVAVLGQNARGAVLPRLKKRAVGSGLVLADFLDARGARLDETVVHFPPGENCYLEIHCHGGAVVASAIAEALESLGAVRISSRRMLLRRHAAGALNAVQAEALLILSDGVTASAASLITQSVDVLTDAVHTNDAHRFTALLEAAGPLERLCKLHRVAVAGAENCGKSTLANALGGSSLVSEIPGTTRDTVRRWVDWNGAMVEIADTAGFGDARTPLHRQAHIRALDAVRAADLVIWLTSPDTVEPATPQEAVGKLLRAANKSDQYPNPHPDSLAVSALTGAGVEELRARVFERLIGGTPQPGIFTARQARVVTQILARKIGPQVLLDETLAD